MTAREEALDREFERGERIEAKEEELKKQLPDMKNELPRKKPPKRANHCIRDKQLDQDRFHCNPALQTTAI